MKFLLSIFILNIFFAAGPLIFAFWLRRNPFGLNPLAFELLNVIVGIIVIGLWIGYAFGSVNIMAKRVRDLGISAWNVIWIIGSAVLGIAFLKVGILPPNMISAGMLLFYITAYFALMVAPAQKEQ